MVTWNFVYNLYQGKTIIARKIRPDILTEISGVYNTYSEPTERGWGWINKFSEISDVLYKFQPFNPEPETTPREEPREKKS